MTMQCKTVWKGRRARKSTTGRLDSATRIEMCTMFVFGVVFVVSARSVFIVANAINIGMHIWCMCNIINERMVLSRCLCLYRCVCECVIVYVPYANDGLTVVTGVTVLQVDQCDLLHVGQLHAVDYFASFIQ